MPGKQVRSARGQLVDFDMLRIKSEMAAAPKPSTVKARENFVDQKLKRRVKRLTKNVEVAQAVEKETDTAPADQE